MQAGPEYPPDLGLYLDWRPVALILTVLTAAVILIGATA
jgi:hypothetical protein